MCVGMGRLDKQAGRGGQKWMLEISVCLDAQSDAGVGIGMLIGDREYIARK